MSPAQPINHISESPYNGRGSLSLFGCTSAEPLPPRRSACVSHDPFIVLDLESDQFMLSRCNLISSYSLHIKLNFIKDFYGRES